jgi:hypothetical protein
MSALHSGSCLCGAIRFEVNCETPQPDVCHCIKCRKHSGHCFASTDIPKSQINIRGDSDLSWYFSSEKIRRGFCRICGSSLFWEPLHRDWIAVAMGAFDGPTNTSLKMNIFVAEKGYYYEITDGVPQH